MPATISGAVTDSSPSPTPPPPPPPKPPSPTDAPPMNLSSSSCSNRRDGSSRNHSSSKHYQPKLSIFRNLESTPVHFTGALCPLNLKEQKERFLQFGITPRFVMKSSQDSVEKITNKERGQIRFTYFTEALTILDAVKKKFGDGAEFIEKMFGERIDNVTASEVLAGYLSENGLDGEMNVYWTPDLTCSAKMMWHGPKQHYNKPEARKFSLIVKNSSENCLLRETGILCLANHEIGTHYFRMVNDGLQPWFSDRSRFQLKSCSSRESSSAEEGLATINTVLQAKSKYLWTSALFYYTACQAANMTFHELFDHLAKYITDKEQRWRHVMRVKRGLRNPSDMGGYGNDQCYFEGAVEILRNLDVIDFELFYSGRLCLEELKRVRRLARVKCIKLPRFMKDMEQYKRNLRQIAIINGLIPKPERTMKKTGAKKNPNFQQNNANNSNRHSLRNSLHCDSSRKNCSPKDEAMLPFCRGRVKSGQGNTFGLLSRPKSTPNMIT